MTRQYPKLPIPAVGVVVLKGADVLLIRRGKAPRAGEWSLPGGGQNLGETVFEAAAREVLEETGVRIDGISLVDVVDSIVHDDAGAVQFHYTLIDVAASWVDGAPVAADDALEAAWFPLDALGELNLWSQTLRIISLAAKRAGISTIPP